MGRLNTPTIPVKTLKALAISRDGYTYKPVLDRAPRDQTIRERAELLAHEIFHNRLAPEAEIVEAIEVEIRRFASRKHL